MAWTIKISDPVVKSLKKMDRESSKRIIDFLKTKVATLDDPRVFGKPLKGNLSDYWRYRVGDYRILCQIHDNELLIIAAQIGHRKDVYKK